MSYYIKLVDVQEDSQGQGLVFDRRRGQQSRQRRQIPRESVKIDRSVAEGVPPAYCEHQ